MIKKLFILLCIFCYSTSLIAQIPLPIKQLLKSEYMKGATFAFVIKDAKTGEIVHEYDINREVIPASVLKTVTTATALELLGADYRYPTSLEYDGEIKDGVLHGNLYIKGSGDPTLGSGHFTSDRTKFNTDQCRFLSSWIKAIKQAGINKITGAIISDESIFDTEGISPKWLQEDMGNYYGAGSYGLNVFDNIYYLYISTGQSGERPVIQSIDPEIHSISLHNYLSSASVPKDSAYITGGPFSQDRYLYGVVPPNRSSHTLKGDIPDPALFLAEILAKALKQDGIIAEKTPSCYRIEAEAGTWKSGARNTICTTYSPPLKNIVRITNERSHNLYADALFKTLGLQYQPRKGEIISSFGRGVKTVQAYWKEKGIDTSSLQIYDGSGLAVTDKVSAAFISDILVYMASQSQESNAFIQSLPLAGSEGTVHNFLKGTPLQGKSRLKSGGMSRVKTYAGYITKDGKEYAVAVFVNNYNCEGREMTRALERLLVALF